MLVAVINNLTAHAFAFGTHDENEEFILVGDPNTKPMWLIVAMCLEEELKKKIAIKFLLSDDFIAVLAKYNDPEVSFLKIQKHVPHSEGTTSGCVKPPSFCVTESRDNTLNRTEFGDYQISIKHKKNPRVVSRAN
jgi:hypothetical protein